MRHAERMQQAATGLAAICRFREDPVSYRMFERFQDSVVGDVTHEPVVCDDRGWLARRRATLARSSPHPALLGHVA